VELVTRFSGVKLSTSNSMWLIGPTFRVRRTTSVFRHFSQIRS